MQRPSVICVNPFDWKRYLPAAADGGLGGDAVPEMYKAVHETAAAETEESSLEHSDLVAPGPRSGRPVMGPAPAGSTVATAAAAVSQEWVQREVESALVEVLGSALPPDEPLMSGALMGKGGGEGKNLCLLILCAVWGRRGALWGAGGRDPS